MPQTTPYPGETADQFYKRMVAQGITTPVPFKYVPPEPTSTQSTPSGGTITLPSLLPAQASGYGVGEIGSAMTAQPTKTTTPRDPVADAIAAANAAYRQPQAATGNQSLASGGSPLSGPSSFAPRSITTPLSGGTMTFGSGGAGGNQNIGAILAALGAGYAAPRKELAKFGKSFQREINQNFKQDVARQEQDAASRGLGNSTIRESLLGGARSRQQNASLALQDRLASARAGLLERQTPSLMQAAQLAGSAVAGTKGTDIRSILKSLGF